jgi:Na+/citrate or Na+/malate symporter
MGKWIEAAFSILVLLAAILLLTVVTRSFLASHMVRDYYLESSSSGGFCVMSSMDGDQDSSVFCSDDINKTLDVLSKAKITLKK